MELQDAYILHTRPWRDTSILVDALLCDVGRVRAIARGQRSQSGRSKGNICQAFRPLAIALRGSGDLKNIQRIEANGPPCLLPGNHLYAGFYANEILLRALPEADPQPTLFLAYQELLALLSQVDSDIEPALRRFELNLLNELGYAVDFYHDADSGAELAADGHYAFLAEQGFVARLGGRGSEKRELYIGSDIVKVGQGEFSSGASRIVAKKIMRQALQPLLGDKPLQSKMLYRPASKRGQ